MSELQVDVNGRPWDLSAYLSGWMALGMAVGPLLALLVLILMTWGVHQ